MTIPSGIGIIDTMIGVPHADMKETYRFITQQTKDHDIVDYANTRGAEKIIHAGYFPMGLSHESIMTELPNVGFKDDVWPKFLRENAAKVLKLDA